MLGRTTESEIGSRDGVEANDADALRPDADERSLSKSSSAARSNAVLLARWSPARLGLAAHSKLSGCPRNVQTMESDEASRTMKGVAGAVFALLTDVPRKAVSLGNSVHGPPPRDMVFRWTRI